MKFTGERTKEFYQERQKRYTKKYKERYLREGLCIDCGTQPQRINRKTCQRCADQSKIYDKRKTEKRRKSVLNHYGCKCQCCGETEEMFLTIDHKNNDGAKHRRRIYGNRIGSGFYHWIIKNNYPDFLQVLCYNCNCGKSRNGGTCPHNICVGQGSE